MERTMTPRSLLQALAFMLHSNVYTTDTNRETSAISSCTQDRASRDPCQSASSLTNSTAGRQSYRPFLFSNDRERAMNHGLDFHSIIGFADIVLHFNRLRHGGAEECAQISASYSVFAHNASPSSPAHAEVVGTLL